jgi:hypothetical protein
MKRTVLTLVLLTGLLAGCSPGGSDVGVLDWPRPDGQVAPHLLPASIIADSVRFLADNGDTPVYAGLSEDAQGFRSMCVIVYPSGAGAEPSVGCSSHPSSGARVVTLNLPTNGSYTLFTDAATDKDFAGQTKLAPNLAVGRF